MNTKEALTNRLVLRLCVVCSNVTDNREECKTIEY